MELKSYSLVRTGKSHLVFSGEKIANETSPSYRRHADMPDARCHWFQAQMFRTKGGRFIVAIQYRFSGRMYRETPFDWAEDFASEDECLKALRGFNAVSCVHGYPPGEFWDKKQAVQQKAIREDFDCLVEAIETTVMGRHVQNVE